MSLLFNPKMAVLPRPGRLYTVSVNTAPPSARLMSIPSIVTTGSMAFRRMCERRTRCSGAPFERAVRT